MNKVDSQQYVANIFETERTEELLRNGKVFSRLSKVFNLPPFSEPITLHGEILECICNIEFCIQLLNVVSLRGHFHVMPKVSFSQIYFYQSKRMCKFWMCIVQVQPAGAAAHTSNKVYEPKKKNRSKMLENIVWDF